MSHSCKPAHIWKDGVIIRTIWTCPVCGSTMTTKWSYPKKRTRGK